MRQPRVARGGVTIILSSALMEGWKKGGHIIKKGGEMIGVTTRLLRVDIKIKAANLKISKQKKNLYGKLSV